MKDWNWPAIGLVAYLAGMVVCFGPATVESTAAKAERRADCEARYADPMAQDLCRVGGPSEADGLLKAMAWPFWLSYQVAKGGK